MRKLILIFAGAALASCASAPPQATNAAIAQQRLAALLAGKTAGQPVDCIPEYHSGSAATLTAHAIAFDVNPGKVYLSSTTGTGCEGLSDQMYTLVTTSHGPSGLCRGDIVKIVDRQVGTLVGGCSLASFVPYTKR